VGHPPLRPGAFDLVTAVAPYVPTGALRLLPADVQHYEPRGALDGGPTGSTWCVRWSRPPPGCCGPGGWLLVEVGGEQDAALAPTLAAAHFAPGEPWRDEDGDLRGVAARRAPTSGGRRR
jgi:release factor glutamine methyltransferase